MSSGDTRTQPRGHNFTVGGGCRFQGTADAVRQYSWIFADLKNNAMEDIIILSGDHLYRMDYMNFVEYHRRSGADCTIGCLPCNEEDASAFGLMKIDDDANITEFAEKPSGEALQAMKVRPAPEPAVCRVACAVV